METLHLGYAVAGGLALLLLLGSSRIRPWPVTGPLLALVTGVVVGPIGLDVLVVSDPLRDPLLLEGSRALLAVSLIGVALRFPLPSIRPHLRPILLLVGIVMPLAAAVTGAAAALLLGLPLALAALLGACLCPTDPVLASDVVTGKRAEEDLPERTRVVLSEESGANDGLALPLVLLALAPVLSGSVGENALTSLYQVLVAVLFGVATGAAVAKALRYVEANGDVEGPSELLLTLVLAITVLGGARVLHSDGVLAVFAAGLAYNAGVGTRNREEQGMLDEVANRYLVIPFFVVIGAVLPWAEWQALGWGGVGFAAAALLVRRPPIILTLCRLLGLRGRDALFAGWFGPIGVSAVFYVTFSIEEGVRDPRLFAAATLAVAVSTLVHGVTGTPGRRLYVRARNRSANG